MIVPWLCHHCKQRVEVDPEAMPTGCSCDEPVWIPIEIGVNDLSEQFQANSMGDGEDRVLFLMTQFGGTIGLIRGRSRQSLIITWRPEPAGPMSLPEAVQQLFSRLPQKKKLALTKEKKP